VTIAGWPRGGNEIGTDGCSRPDRADGSSHADRRHGDGANQLGDLGPGSSRVEPRITPAADVTLSWPTFTDAAVQAGRSRRYDRIHFKEADLTGQAIGREVGARAWEAAGVLFGGRREGGEDA
jgi:hypothetical protein